MKKQPATMSPEMDAWVSARRDTEIRIAAGIEVFREDHEGIEPRRTSPIWTRSVELSDAEWRFVWSRFQGVSLPMLGFARRLQVATADVMTFSPEQRCWVLALAFKYRRKVFFNPRAGRLDEQAFVRGIRDLTAKAGKPAVLPSPFGH